MAEMSDYLESALINHVLRNVPFTSPTTVYVSLHSASPTDVGGSELSGNGYARQSAAFDAPGATDGLTQNTAQVKFTAAGGDWSEATHLGIYDALTGGNLLFWTPLDANRTATDTDSINVAAGALTVTLA